MQRFQVLNSNGKKFNVTITDQDHHYKDYGNNINQTLTEKQLNECYEDYYLGYRTIFCVPSCSLPGENDFEIVQDLKTGKYCIGLETIYEFETKKQECQYLIRFLNELEKWIADNKIPVDFKYSIDDIFTDTTQTNNICNYKEFDTFAECVTWFRFTVCGFVNQSYNLVKK